MTLFSAVTLGGGVGNLGWSALCAKAGSAARSATEANSATLRIPCPLVFLVGRCGQHRMSSLGQKLRDSVGNIQDHRMFVRRGFFQGGELAVQKRRRHEMAFALLHAVADQLT